MADTRCPECSGMRGLPKLVERDGKMQECAHAFHGEPEPTFHPAVTRPAPEIPLEEPQVPDAICPHCGATPMEVFFREVKFPDGRRAYIFQCSACNKVVPVALQPVVIAPTPKPMPPPPGGKAH